MLNRLVYNISISYILYSYKKIVTAILYIVAMVSLVIYWFFILI